MSFFFLDENAEMERHLMNSRERAGGTRPVGRGAGWKGGGGRSEYQGDHLFANHSRTSSSFRFYSDVRPRFVGIHAAAKPKTEGEGSAIMDHWGGAVG